MILTQAEFNIAYNKALRLFGEYSIQENYGDRYGLQKSCSHKKGDRLWLYVFALATWNNAPGATNYLTEDQMLAIVHKVQLNNN